MHPGGPFSDENDPGLHIFSDVKYIASDMTPTPKTGLLITQTSPSLFYLPIARWNSAITRHF
jgi:hypothetical protein